MKCREFIDLLVDYYDGHLAGDELMNFDQHQQHCHCCAAYAATYGDTIRLGRAACHTPDDAPGDDVPEHLVRRILDARDHGHFI